ncbi:nonribosomal siderophore peptide synthase [Anopheles sinensis]|uniref:Nonribosomal siderophore peptide synthase n=1 Tax=Anopheles sinensis TaxID=74873 RepID=A0A084WDL5_ANOSI|nr:nonribosomal siderophore peptide synthase [Anopheles sinensis]
MPRRIIKPVALGELTPGRRRRALPKSQHRHRNISLSDEFIHGDTLVSNRHHIGLGLAVM